MADENREGKGKMTVEEAGRKGGEIGGHKGGEATLEKHGPEFYSEIGKKGWGRGQRGVRRKEKAGR